MRNKHFCDHNQHRQPWTAGNNIGGGERMKTTEYSIHPIKLIGVENIKVKEAKHRFY